MKSPDIKALKAFEWLRPWEAFPEVEPRTEGGDTGYDLELVREIGPKHPMYPYKSRAIPVGARVDCDDRLYWIPDDQHPFAVVHITWAGRSQQWSSDIPTTEFYSSLEDWMEHRMKRDHELGKQLNHP
jgi:hypothetical protein